MKNHWFGLLMAGSAFLLLTAVTMAQGQSQLPPAPKGFDVKRGDIDRGKIETLEYDSKTVGAKRKMVVYTPPGFSKETKYPVFYLCHGKGGNEANWTKAGAAGTILDNLYADKKLVPMIVVMPNGTVAAPEGKKDFTSGFENELLKDVMPVAESRFPIQADAEHRALAGLSMGGGQSLRIGLKHLDKFAWIGGYSSALGGGTDGLIPDADAAKKKLKLLYVACGDADTLYKSNLNFHNSLDKKQVQHIWNVVPAGKHDYLVWKNDLYLFSQMLFKDKK